MIELFNKYIITKNGEVYSKRTGNKLKTYIRNGYLTITINKKNYKVHRLVALYYISNIDNKPQVNHINGVKTDNQVENLEWVTAKENMQHASQYGLLKHRVANKFFGKDNGMAKLIYQIKNDTIINIFQTINDAKQYCINNGLGSGTSISKCLYSNRKTAYGFQWTTELI